MAGQGPKPRGFSSAQAGPDQAEARAVRLLDRIQRTQGARARIVWQSKQLGQFSIEVFKEGEWKTWTEA